ncbi:MAG: glycosyl transferase, partial [Caulobacteraceae bacterium]|nr:glycosyl transferase [Caulobacter sp.]
APILLALALWDAFVARDLRALRRRLLDWAAVLVIAWIGVWAVYGFRYAAAPQGLTLSPPLDTYLATLPNAADGRLLALAGRLHLLPEAYLWGLANTKLTEFADTAYLFGHVYRHGPWWYFPAAFLIKSTLPLLILVAVAAVLRLDRLIGAQRLGALLIPPALYFAVVSSSHFDIGVRHLLPVYPFLYVVAAGGAALLIRRGRFGALAMGALMAWQAVTCLRAWPAYMAYGNEAWGGPPAVHRYLSDANVDWGQQLKGVKAWLDAHGANGDCWFAYFPDGAIEPADYGVNCRRLPTTDNLWWLDLPMQVPPAISGTVLISDSDLEGIEFGDGELNPYDGFRRLKPDAVIQGGVDVYRGRFAVPLAAALVRVRDSSRLQTAGDTFGALQAAASAAALAPRSAIVQVRLAETLAARGRPAEAQARFLLARDLVREVRPDLQAAELTPKVEAGLKATRAAAAAAK